MLKWAVYKKNQDGQASINPQSIGPDLNTNNLYNDKSRRSLDAQVVRNSKKPNRCQRRSIGATARRNNTKNIDKENINFIGNTPNCYKAGFMKNIENIALKDVSNITPTSATSVKKFENFLYYVDEKDVPLELPPTPSKPPSNSRRVREAKKRKLEINSSNNSEVFARNSSAYKFEKRTKNVDRSLLCSPKLSHSTLVPSLNDIFDTLSANTSSRKSSIHLESYRSKNKTVCSTKTSSEGIVEIEYDEDLVINCLENPLVKQNEKQKSTLPSFGHRIFTDNPLYLKKNKDVPISIKSLKRTRTKMNDFETSFKSPSIDKRDVHSLVRDACSPVSLSPLAVNFEELRFSAMSSHVNNEREIPLNDFTQYLRQIENHLSLTVKDEENSVEMENKFILCKDSLMSTTESTVSTTQMGDVTLEKMIEDIIKSTKIVKSKKRVINKQTDIKSAVEEETPNIEALKDLFVKPQTDSQVNLIKEAKYVNLSCESSISPKNSPTKKKMRIHKVNEKLLKNVPIGRFLLIDNDDYNERDVRMADNLVNTKTVAKNHTDNKPLIRSYPINVTCSLSNNLEHTLSQSTPDQYNIINKNNDQLRRQKSIRKKKNTIHSDSFINQNQMETDSTKSSLVRILEMGIPSPALDLQNVSLCEPLNSPFQTHQQTTGDNKNLHYDSSDLNKVLHSSLMSYELMSNRNIRSRELFGLTLQNGIPSPLTSGMKRTSDVLSIDRTSKTSKLDENLILSNVVTPVIQHKISKRFLMYSPEESEVTGRNMARNRSKRNCDRHQRLKETIDFESNTRHDQSLPSQRLILQNTFLLYGENEQEFQWHLKLPPSTVV